MRWMRTVLFLLVTVWIPGGILAQPLKTTGVSVGPDGVVQVQGLGRFKMPLPPPPRKLTVGRLRPPGHVLIHVKVLGRGGRAAELVLEVGKGTKPIFVGATGPQGVDGEWSRHLQVSTRGLLLYQRRDGASRCDGKEAYLFPRMFDFGSRSFRPVSMRPAVQGLPVVKASRSARGVPAGEPMNTFQVVFASTHRGDQQQAENLTAPRELEDGDPATSWSESLGGFGQGELLTARSQHTPYRLRAIRILPGDTASKKTFAEANRIKSLVLVLGRGHRLRVQFPRDPLRDRGGFQTPYWIVLPKPIATRCVTLVIHQVHAGRQAGGKRGGGRTAISELRLFTDLEYGGGMEQLVKDLGSQNERRANAAVVVLSRLGVRGIEAVSKGIGKATGKTLNRMLRVLTRSRHPASAAPLAEALPRLDRVRQRLALEALARLGAVAVKPLAALLDLKDLPLRLVARALGSIRHGEVRPALLSRAGSGSEARRAAIVEGLATMRGGADDLEALLDAAASSGAPARRADLIYAVTRLGRRIPAARSAAAARLATIWTGASSEPFELRYRLLAGIGALDPGAHLPLLASASSPRSVKDPVLRWLAVQQLRRVQQPRATVALLLAAGDPSPRIRSTAALSQGRALRRFPFPARWRFVTRFLSFSIRATVSAERCSRYSSKTSRTRTASTGLTRSFRSRTSYPRGTLPPVHFPRRRAAAILSRVLSAIMSRSKEANDINRLRVSFPMESEVEKFWVTLTKATP